MDMNVEFYASRVSRYQRNASTGHKNLAKKQPSQ